MNNLDIYLRPTRVIDSDHPSVAGYAGIKSNGAGDAISRACSLFAAVRDEIAYNPHTDFHRESHYCASNVLARKNGYCVSKACLLCALGRASGIPSRIGLADIRNHGAGREIVELMGTDIFPCHGFVEFFLNGRITQ